MKSTKSMKYMKAMLCQRLILLILFFFNLTLKENSY